MFYSGNTKTTEIGYINENKQENCGHRNLPGTDHNQLSYKIKCLLCGHIYGANGSDIFQRKCPSCQDGAEGIEY